MSNPPPGYPRVSPYLLYEDAAAAVEYLQEKFGFELGLSEIGGRRPESQRASARRRRAGDAGAGG
jgi:uncharacterized glyoxalase superfamily protein PhnB